MRTKQVINIVIIVLCHLIIIACSGGDVLDGYVETVGLADLFFNGQPQFTDISIEKIFDLKKTTSNSVQSIAIYGDELFSFHDTNDVIDIYNLNNYTHKKSIILTPQKTTHCNNASFRSYSANSESKYPLLYLMERGILHRMLVFKFVESNGELVANKMQTIDLGTDTTAIAYVDSNTDKLYIHYYLKGMPNVRYLSRFDIPDVKDSIYSMSIADAQETVIMEKSAMQDATINEGGLFMLQGYSNSGQLFYNKLSSHEVFLLMDLPKYGLKGEPEGIAVYNNSLILSFYDRSVFKLSFLNKRLPGLCS